MSTQCILRTYNYFLAVQCHPDCFSECVLTVKQNPKFFRYMLRKITLHSRALHGSGSYLSTSRRKVSGFNPVPTHVRFVLDEMALGKVFLQELRVFPVCTIPKMPQTHLLLIILLLSEIKSDEAWEPSSKAMLFRI